MILNNKNNSSLIRMLPLAITQSDSQHACVAGITDTGLWIRPEPVLLKTLKEESSCYSYSHWLKINVNPSVQIDARPEDRLIINPPYLDSIIDPAHKADIFNLILDNSIEEAFSNKRSVGFIEASINNIYIKPSTGGKKFIRIIFNDATNKNYDWIIPEIKLTQLIGPHVANDTISARWLDILLTILTEKVNKLFLTIGLTKPNYKFPGIFRDCHPLVVGVHTIPDYEEFNLLK